MDEHLVLDTAREMKGCEVLGRLLQCNPHDTFAIMKFNGCKGAVLVTKAAEWFKELWEYAHIRPTDPVLWHCKPLLVLNANSEIVGHLQTVDVLFTPSGEKTPAGRAEIVNYGEVLDWGQLDIETLSIFAPHRYAGGREGINLTGHCNGKRMHWYTDGRADNYFHDLSAGDLALPVPNTTGDDPTHPIG